MTMSLSYSFKPLLNLVLPSYSTAFNPDSVGLSGGGFVTIAEDSYGYSQISYYNSTGQITASRVYAYTDAAVAQLANGNVVSVGTKNGISFNITSSTGVAIGGGNVSSQSTHTNADVAGLANGGFVVIEQIATTATINDLQYIIYDSNGQFVTSHHLVDILKNDINASVAGLADGGFAVAWERVDSLGNSAAWVAVYNSNGSVRQAPAQFDGLGTINHNMSVTALPSGEFTVSYEDNQLDATQSNIEVVIFKASGLRYFTQGSYSTANENDAAAATLSNGFVVTTFTTQVDFGHGLEGAIAASLLNPANGSTLIDQANPPLLAADGNDGESSVASIGLAQFIVSYSSGSYGDVREKTFQLVRTANGDAGNDTFTGDDAVDIVNGLGGSDNLNGGANDDMLNGGDGNDILLGGSGNDALNGGNNNDFLSGDDGNDTLNGGAGVDALVGGLGNDVYYVDNGGDEIAEDIGGGTDQVYSAVSFTLGIGQEIEKLATTLASGLGAINLTGNAFGNSITGNSGVNVLSGGAGNDILNGGLGVDTLIGGDGSDVYYANVLNEVITETNAVLATGGSDTVYFTGIAGTFILGANVERLALSGVSAINGTGNALANTIIGNGAANILNGGADAVADTLYGNGGNDIFILNTATDNIVEVAGGGTADRAKASVSFTLAAGDNIEFLETTDAAGLGAINLTGNEIAQAITGNAGANILNGGIDALADVLTGGLGNDTYVINTANDNIIELAGGGTADRARASLSFTLAAGDNIEFLETTNAAGIGALNLIGNEIAQTINGNAGANVLNGGIDALADTLVGGLGNDIYVINSAIDNITELAGGGLADRALLSVSFTLAAGDNIEILTTTNAALTTALNLTGNEIGQFIAGNAGSNIIAGAGGNDTLTGGLGNDFFLFNTAANSMTNFDIITDFNVAADTIQLENAVFAALGAAGALTSAMFKNLTTGGAVDPTDRILYDDATGALFYDSDGSGVAVAVEFATLSGSPTVFFSDFVVI